MTDEFNELPKDINLIFGDFWQFANIKINDTLQTSATLFKELNRLERKLFTCFVLYALSEIGYYPQSRKQIRFDFSKTGNWERKIFEAKKTTEMEEKDWIKLILNPFDGMGDSFSPELLKYTISHFEFEMTQMIKEYGEPRNIPIKYIEKYIEFLTEPLTRDTEPIWYCDFTDGNEQAFRVIFIGRTFAVSEQNDLIHINIHEDMFNRKVENYILLNPLLDTPDAQQMLSKLLSQMKFNSSKIGKTNWTITNIKDLTIKYGSDPRVIGKIRETWRNIRVSATTQILERKPILLKALRHREIDFNDQHMRLAFAEYDLDHKIDAIRQACFVVENIMRLLYEQYVDSGLISISSDEPLSFGGLLESQHTKLRSTIRNIFGEDIEKDIDYIIEIRNKISHPNGFMKLESTISKSTTIKILNKCRNVYDLFTLHIKGESI
jgi:hypothetical protein